MAANNFWDNPDGLRVQFNKRLTENNIAAQTGNPASGRKVVELIITGSALPLTTSVAPDARAVYIPTGAVVESAKLVVSTAFVGATATLNVGTWGVLPNASGALIGETTIIAAAAVGTLTANAVITGAGAQVGARVTNVNGIRISAMAGTALFTAGVAKLVIEYIEPAVQNA